MRTPVWMPNESLWNVDSSHAQMLAPQAPVIWDEVTFDYTIHRIRGMQAGGVMNAVADLAHYKQL